PAAQAPLARARPDHRRPVVALRDDRLLVPVAQPGRPRRLAPSLWREPRGIPTLYPSMPTEPVILRGAPTTPQHWLRGGELFRLWPMLFMAGCILTVTGWADVALFWIPPRFGEADWEFGT